MAKPDSDELVNEIEQIRERLADTVDELIDRTNPKTIARRSLTSLKGRFVEPNGTPKLAVIAPIAAGIAAIIAVIALLRRLLR